jgi:hypothetical protein
MARKKAPLPEFDTPDPEAVAAVADEIRGHGKLPPLSDEEREQRRLEQQIWREQQQWLAEKRRIEWERQQAEAEEVAKREQAAAATETAREARLARQQEIDRLVREKELRSLRLEVSRQSWWQNQVEAATRNAARQQYTNSLMGELEKMLAPPAPPPEPEIIYAEPEEEVGICGIKPVRWH